MKKWNETYACRVIKYTINLPRDLHAKAVAKQKRLRLAHLSDYIRIVLDRDIEYDKTRTMLQNTQMAEQAAFVNPQPNMVGLDEAQLVRPERGPVDHPDLPRKYMGFVAGLLRSSYVLQWTRGKKR